MPKRLILCCDGTWNTPTQKEDGQLSPTNVAKLARSILPTAPDGTPQITFYHDGVGAENRLTQLLTGSSGFKKFSLKFMQALLYGPAKLAGGAFGIGLSRIIEECYCFLVDNFEQGDELYLFGFSRGAYAVRSLAGLVRNSGILRKEHADRFAEAYRYYRDRDILTHPRSDQSAEFRTLYSRETSIKFIGVWDTVGSLGIPEFMLDRMVGNLWKFHDASLSTRVENAFQALALDERRGDFKPCLWEKQPDAPSTQVVEQVWFAGVHCDVGGGYADSGLSDCTLAWMINRASGGNCRLACSNSQLQELLHPDPLAEIHNSLKGFFSRRPTFIRPVNQGRSSMESVSTSVQERKDHPPSLYDPENLQGYSGSFSTVALQRAQTTGG